MIVTGWQTDDDWRKWAPHESYHKDGTSHQKSFDHKVQVRTSQTSDRSFKGTYSFPRIGIGVYDARVRQTRCDPTEFDDVLEIKSEPLDERKGQIDLAIDLTERGGPAVLPPGVRVLFQDRLDDDVPEILVTVFQWNPGPMVL